MDVPQVVNLVFARKIFSEAKFWQMVGRGTRLCPGVFGEDGDKEHFLIIDFALNFDEEHSFKDPNGKQLPIQQKYFETRLEYLKLLEHREDKKRYEKEKNWIIQMAKELYKNGNDEIFERKSLFESIINGRIFDNIAVNPYEELQKIAPLMRYYDYETIEEIRFLFKTVRFKIALLKNEDPEEIQTAIATDINSLPSSISAVAQKEDKIREILTVSFWKNATIETIENLGTEFAPLMKYRKPIKDIPLIIDESDDVIERRWIDYAEGKKMASDKYWEVFVGELEQYAKSSKAIKKILSDEPVNQDDIAELERLFQQSEYRITLNNLRRAYNRPTVAFEQLIKVALGKASMPEWETEVSELFDEYIRENNFSSQQIRFLQIVKSIITQKRFILFEEIDYNESIERAFGLNAFSRLFNGKDQQKVMEFVGKFRLV